MALSSSEMHRLERAGAALGGKAQGSFLEEAIASLRRTASPTETLRLLAAMWGSPFANRPDQRRALGEVGKWLEDRIRREPTVPVDQLLRELGWLKRIRKSNEKSHVERRPQRGKGDQKTRPFGNAIDHLEQERSRAMSSQDAAWKGKQPAHAQPPPPPPTPTPKPTSLPPSFEARFVDPDGARLVRRKAKDRRKARKPVKDSTLPLVPKDAALRPLASGLFCSVGRTEGIDAVLEAMAAGGPVTLVVHEVTPLPQGKQLAARVSPTQGSRKEKTA